MRKLHLGCGLFRISGWENHDKDLDISKSLLIEDKSVDFIFCEHVIEHILPLEVYSFLKEVHRVLKINGVIRVAFPDLSKVVRANNTEYNRKVGLEKVITGWEHKTFLNFDLLVDVCRVAGLMPDERNYRPEESNHEELRNLEQHWKLHSKRINDIETSCLEATNLRS